MSRCQHCNKLTHSEHLDVYFDSRDGDKVLELQAMINWKPKYLYEVNDLGYDNPYEYGRIKVGDIIIHFICKKLEG